MLQYLLYTRNTKWQKFNFIWSVLWASIEFGQWWYKSGVSLVGVKEFSLSFVNEPLWCVWNRLRGCSPVHTAPAPNCLWVGNQRKNVNCFICFDVLISDLLYILIFHVSLGLQLKITTTRGRRKASQRLITVCCLLCRFVGCEGRRICDDLLNWPTYFKFYPLSPAPSLTALSKFLKYLFSTDLETERF